MLDFGAYVHRTMHYSNHSVLLNIFVDKKKFGKFQIRLLDNTGGIKIDNF